MYPMIATLDELQQAKEITEEARRSVGADPVELGMMIEVPSSAMMADEFAPEVDFFSIGTNDLTQYVLAMDRLHPQLARQADGLHPAVLRMIDQTVRAAASSGEMGRRLRRRRRRPSGRGDPQRPRGPRAEREHPQHRRGEGADPHPFAAEGQVASAPRLGLPNGGRGPRPDLS